ncbi:MAG: hypothetical protein AAF840_02900, partial [Bacteroidota bacterium]
MLTKAQEQQWYGLVEAHLNRGTFFLDFPDGKDWYCFVDTRDQQRLQRETRKWFRGHLPKETEATYEPSDWLGFLVPVDEIERMDSNYLQVELEVLSRYFQGFNWRQYLFQTATSVASHQEATPVLAGLWHYCWFYAKLLRKARRERADLLPLLQSLPGATEFTHRLPTEQCLELLLHLIRRPYGQLWDEEDFMGLVYAARPPVRAFFLKYRILLEATVVGTSDAGIREAEAAFYQLCQEDYPFVLGQQVMTQEEGSRIEGLSFTLQQTLREKGRATSAGTTISLQRGFNRLRRLLSGPSSAPASAPIFRKAFVDFAPADGPKWYELEAEVLEELARTERLPSVAGRIQEEYYSRLLNHFTRPVLRWEKENNFRPQWHLPAKSLAEATQRLYEDRQALAAEETKILEDYLIRLGKVPTMAGVR